MKVAEKYKQTELGTIPEEWSVVEFQEVMDGFSSGQTPYRGKPEFYTGNIPWITSGELNYNVITDTKEKITPEGVQDANLKIIPKGTFLFAITGLEAAGTMGSCAVTGIEATTNQSCMALYPKKGLLITPYLYHFYVRYGNELAFKYCQGTKQQSFTGGIAKKLPIIVPPTLEEQTAIATALSDADALISSLEKLVAKKRMIKQGAMQQLLQAKEGWVVKKLGEICENIGSGKSKTQSIEGEFPIFGSTGIIGWSNTFDYSGHKILVARVGANAGTVNIVDGNYCVSDNTLMVSLKPETDLHFIYSFLILFQLNKLVFGSGQPLITGGQIKNIEVPLPTTIKEQTRIATILSDMDAEIAALEAKLEKYRKVKMGMMQNLLTGKIRLI